jgi:acyl-CoA reductase-like NAD-dependent aldehyde dehydrogenase
VILASNLPALVVQPLLPALAARRPVLLKSPSSEPLFTPAFVRALAGRLPPLSAALAAATWRGGDQAVERPLLARAATVLAYGGDETVESLRRRAAGAGTARVVGYAARTSLAVVAEDADLHRAAAGLARDVALFDQRGCLSVAAVYAEGGEGRARELARTLAEALGKRAQSWPPGPAAAAELGAVQQVRSEAALRGLFAPEVAGAARDPRRGTVVVEPRPDFRPTPGLRTVRVHPVADLTALPALLEPWRGRLQGAALAGERAQALARKLEALGVSRTTSPGELQSPDARWHNGGIDPLEALLDGSSFIRESPSD